MVLGSNLLNPSIEYMKKFGVIGKWYGFNLDLEDFKKWWQERWGKELSLKALANGFFFVLCPSVKIKMEILEGIWLLNEFGFYLCDWFVGFDPKKHNWI